MFIGIITSLNIFYWAISILLPCFPTLYIKELLSKVIYLYHILREILNSQVDFCKTIPRDKKNLLVELFTHRGLCSDGVLLLHLLNEQRIQRNFSLILSFIFIQLAIQLQKKFVLNYLLNLCNKVQNVQSKNEIIKLLKFVVIFSCNLFLIIYDYCSNF